jgi:hypothetical protein
MELREPRECEPGKTVNPIHLVHATTGIGFAPDFCEIVRQTARTVNREPHSTAVLKSVLIMQVAKPIPCYCPNTPRLALLDPLNHGRQACALRRIVHLQNAGLEIAKHAFQLPPCLAFDNHIVRQFFSLVGIAEVESGGK